MPDLAPCLACNGSSLCPTCEGLPLASGEPCPSCGGAGWCFACGPDIRSAPCADCGSLASPCPGNAPADSPVV